MKYVIKKYRLAYIINFLSFAIAFGALMYLNSSRSPIVISREDLLYGFFLFIPAALLHEYSHYIVAKRYTPEARIRIYPKLGALILDYVRLTYGQYAKTVFAPMLTIQLPLIVLYMIFNSPTILVAAILHFLASSIDIIGFVVTSITHYGGTFHIVYGEKGEIAGILVVEPKKGIATFYQL
jgi:hypothetical protein